MSENSNSNLHRAKRGSIGYSRRALGVSATRGSASLVQGAAIPVTEGDWDRFWSKVDVAGDCWLCTRSLSSRGYGQFSFGGRGAGGPIGAHVFAWTVLVGEVGVGLELDHLCRVKSCVNPDHLEPVTRKVNTQRGNKVVTAFKNTLLCSLPGCDQRYFAKDLCRVHYNQEYRRARTALMRSE